MIHPAVRHRRARLLKSKARWTRASAKIEADVISCVHQVYDERRDERGGWRARAWMKEEERREEAWNSERGSVCPDGSDFIALEFLLTERLDKNN